jgi:hypothetical protein
VSLQRYTRTIKGPCKPVEGSTKNPNPRLRPGKNRGRPGWAATQLATKSGSFQSSNRNKFKHHRPNIHDTTRIGLDVASPVGGVLPTSHLIFFLSSRMRAGVPLKYCFRREGWLQDNQSKGKRFDNTWRPWQNIPPRFLPGEPSWRKRWICAVSSINHCQGGTGLTASLPICKTNIT